MRLILAPLHGVTNRVFREAYYRHFTGLDETFAPFILAVRTNAIKPTHFKDLLPSGSFPSPESDSTSFQAGSKHPALIPQLLGNEADAFFDTVLNLKSLGYDEINWNLGCPYPMVTKKQRGAGLLPFPDRIAKVLDAVCSIPGIKISVKLRLGMRDPEEILRLMPVLNARPLSRVILHPRLGTQMYRGQVDLEGFSRAAELCGHPLVYNGDIRDLQGFRRMEAAFPAIESWMLGRGILADPFLPQRIRGGKAASGLDLERLGLWLGDLYQSYRLVLCGPAHPLDKMKEVWRYLAPNFPKGAKHLERIAQAKQPADYEAAVKALLAC